MSKKQESVVKSAIYFASGTFASRVLGLIRDALFVAVFGKTVSDAWLAAFRFPNLFRRIFGEGALSACFIPVYIDYKEQGSDKKRAELTAGLFLGLSVILIPFTVIMILGMETIMPWIVSGDGFTTVPGKVDMTIRMTKIMFPFLYLMSLFAYFMAILNAHKKFMASALAPCYFNLVNIAASLWCYVTGVISGDVLSWAVVVGGVFQFATLLPTFFKLQIPWNWTMANMWSPSVRRVLKTFMPSLLGLGVVQFMGLMNISFASHLEEGSVTYIYLADRLLELPLSMVAVSLGTVLLPTLSEKLSRGDRAGYKKDILNNLKVLLFLCIPASVGLFMISEPLVALIFQRGTFQHEQSVVVAGVVQIYSATLIGASLSRVMGQSFYASKDTLTPALAAVVGLVLHLFLAPILMQRWKIYGLVGSTSMASFANALFLFTVFYFKQGTFGFYQLLSFATKCVVATIPMILICRWMRDWMSPSSLSQLLLYVFVAVVSSGLTYFLMTAILKLEESRLVVRKLSGRFGFHF